jgi:uncharacterized protein (DUF362 family)
MTRRELLRITAAGAAAHATLAGAAAKQAPTAPVALARAASYDEDITAIMSRMFDQLDLSPRVRNKTVTIKLNLTGSPGLRFMGRPLGVTHYTHPKTVGAMAHLLGRAGARRIRFVESAWASNGPLEEYLLDSGWNVRALAGAAPNVEFENTNALGKGKSYARFKVPGGGLIFPAYDLNQAYRDTDVFVSMAKLKNHATCGVTLAMKNIFGITPASIYGDDAGADAPNESPGAGRVKVCHMGTRPPSKSALAEIDLASSREPEHRMPRIVAELNVARPVDIAFIDGVESIAGGEGPWVKDIRLVKPGLLIMGTNAVTTDAVATAAMGYDPRAARGTAPFAACDNSLLLAEGLGVGTADLGRIEVRGLALRDAVHRFAAPPARPA